MSDHGDPGFTFIGVLLLAAIGAFAWRSAPLESARPPTESTAQPEILTEEHVPARLWQDPLKAVQLYQQIRDTQALKRGKGLREAINELAEQAESNRLTVLSVMVSPGAYSELEERRRRRRYATLAGLGDANFVPQDAEALGVLSVGLPSHTPPDIESEDKDSTPTFLDAFLIPYEWYEFEDRETGSQLREDTDTGNYLHDKVLLLWLDESHFTDQPFAQFLKVISAILPDKSTLIKEGRAKLHITWKVVGPARSGTLRTFVADQCSNDVRNLHDDGRLERFDILSPVATVSNEDLLKHRPNLPCGGEASNRTDLAPPLFGGFFGAPCGEQHKTCLRFLRTIRSDNVLIAALKHELIRRGLKNHDDVVILSEWDTYFGRYLPRAFDASSNGADAGSGVAAQPQFRSLRYTYARGIDGITAGIAPKPLLKMAPDQDLANILSPTENLAVRRPEGTGQFDYLRRLADRISVRDRQLRLEKSRGVRAVAILGSDVYDKLLILRALRHRLPGAVWITTDLDAQFLHPGDFAWTRNLIIGATFGLSLPRDIQPSSPPFRDSYQTAIYLATRMAVDMDSIRDVAGWQKRSDTDSSFVEPYPTQDQMNHAIPPRLFEIGRHGVVPLGTEEGTPTNELNAAGDATQKLQTRAHFIGGVLIAILALFALHQLRPRSGRPVLSIGALILSAGLLALVAVLQKETGEPISLFDGVSIWPTEFIRLVTVFLSVSFLWTANKRLQSNASVLDNRYFCAGKPREDTGLTLQQAKDRLLVHLKGMTFHAWSGGTLLLTIVLMLAMTFIGKWQWWLDWKLLALGVGWALAIILWWLFVNGKLLPSVHVRSINQWLAQERYEQEQTATELWTVYREYGSPKHRVLRSMSYVLVYMAFGTLVFSLLGSAAPPCRGTTACAVDGVLLGFGVLLMLFLLFFVVDATRLCIAWIEALQSPELNWDDTCSKDMAKQLGLPDSHATYYLQIHLIGERTTEVGRLLYYPVVIILLILLARSTYFDDWGFPQALAVVVGMNFLIAIFTAARLNAAAKQARDRILGRLRRESLELRALESQQPAVATPDELKELISQLSQLRIGAFQHLWDQPLIRGSLLLLSGIGITYIEYLPLS